MDYIADMIVVVILSKYAIIPGHENHRPVEYMYMNSDNVDGQAAFHKTLIGPQIDMIIREDKFLGLIMDKA